MGFYKYLRELWKKPSKNIPEFKYWLFNWRRENSVVRVDKPLRVDRARSLGYRAKQGFCVYRVRVRKGGRKREQYHAGRKPKKAGLKRFSTGKSLKWIGEERVQRKHPNLVVIGSYEVGDDGKHKYFEVLMVDPHHPNIYKSEEYAWSLFKKKNALRGLTSSGRKSRGLRK